MKKSGAILIILLISAIAIFMYVKKAKNDKYFDITITFVDDLPLQKNDITIYALDEYQNIVPVTINVKEDVNLNYYIFNVYSIHQNVLPLHFYSPLSIYLQINDLEIEEKTIEITIEKEIVEEKNMEMLTFLLLLSYEQLSIERVIINIDDKKYDSNSLNLLK